MKIALDTHLTKNKLLVKKLQDLGITIHDDADYILSKKQVQKTYIIGKDKYGIKTKINVCDIDCFESDNRKILFKSNKQVYIYNAKLFEIEEQFMKVGFMRINKSQIINLNKIYKIRSNFSRQFLIIMHSGERFDVNRTYYNAFKERLEE